MPSSCAGFCHLASLPFPLNQEQLLVNSHHQRILSFCWILPGLIQVELPLPPSSMPYDLFHLLLGTMDNQHRVHIEYIQNSTYQLLHYRVYQVQFRVPCKIQIICKYRSFHSQSIQIQNQLFLYQICLFSLTKCFQVLSHNEQYYSH